MTWKTFDELEQEIKAEFPGYRVRMHEDADGDTVEVTVGKYPSVTTSAKRSKELIYETVVNRVLRRKLMEMNIENMNLNDLIDLREKLSDAIEKAKEEKYRDIKTGDVYTISNANGTKVVYLVLDEDENDSEYVDDELCAIVSVKYLCFFIDKNGFPISCGENSSERMDFVENVRYADVKHECFDPYEYEDAVDKLQLDFYRKVNN